MDMRMGCWIIIALQFSPLSGLAGTDGVTWVPRGKLYTGVFPRAMDVFPDGKTLAVTHSSYESSHLLLIFSCLETGEPSTEIPILSGIHSSLGVDRAGEHVFVANDNAGTVTRVNVKSGVFTHRIFGRRIRQIHMTPDRETVLVMAEKKDGKFALTSLPVSEFDIYPDKARGTSCQLPSALYEYAAPFPRRLSPAAFSVTSDGETAYVVATSEPLPVPCNIALSNPEAGEQSQPSGAETDIEIVTLDVPTMTVAATVRLSLSEVFGIQGVFTNQTVIPGGVISRDVGGSPRLFIAHPAYGVLACDPRTGGARWAIPLKGYPSSLAVAGKNDVLVTARNRDGLVSLDVATGEITGDMTVVCEDPISVRTFPGSPVVYVASSFTDGITVLAPGEGETTAQTYDQPPPSSERSLRVLFAGVSDGVNGVFSMAVDGDGGFYEHCRSERVLSEPVISADGRYLAFKMRMSSGFDLFSLDAETRKVIPLTRRGNGGHPDEIDVGAFSWYPNRSRLAFTGIRGHGDTAIYSIRPDGTGEVLLKDDFGDHNQNPVIHVFNPDILLYTYEAGNWSYDCELRMENRLTGRWLTLGPNDGLGYTACSVLPDGRMSVCRSLGGIRTPRQLVIIDPLEKISRQLVRSEDLTTEFFKTDLLSGKTLVTFGDTLRFGFRDLETGEQVTFSQVPKSFTSIAGVAWVRMPVSFLRIPTQIISFPSYPAEKEL
ncbi:MAG: hypothetical protein RRC34_07280 [Lentisphaeria bacterium]|nr:hypothetical protein [Lentisphaeria bacterium]